MLPMSPKNDHSGELGPWKQKTIYDEWLLPKDGVWPPINNTFRDFLKAVEDSAHLTQTIFCPDGLATGNG